jgi:hypothetical protein
MAAKASTPADHRALEEYFLTLAKRYTGEAADHKAMASAYRGLPRSPGWAAGAAAHCDRLATLSGESANEAAGAAAMHKQLAGVGGNGCPLRPGRRFRWSGGHRITHTVMS